MERRSTKREAIEERNGKDMRKREKKKLCHEKGEIKRKEGK